jgi:UDP-N-acetylmuramyl tripeptide synthase
MDLRLTTALTVAKLTAFALKTKGSGATAAPGLIALKIDPNLISKLCTRISGGSIIISGTNGKTTTARLAFDALSKDYKIIHNRQGSNLMRGIASALIAKTTISGKVLGDLAIWETDEATLPAAINDTSAQIIVLLNLFRDQLDRYGEVEATRQKWQETILKLPKTATIILNADDPGVASFYKSFSGKTVAFGINDPEISTFQTTGVLDIKNCPICQSKLIYKTYTFGHLGDYKCTKCDFKKPSTQVTASNLLFGQNFVTSAKITIANTSYKTTYNLPGIYNVYNVLAAASIATALKIAPKKILDSTRNFTPVFGRFQKIQIKDKSIYIFLIKNPTGANEVLKVLSANNNINLLTILNDNFADGTDVSWIWDTNWETLSQNTNNITISGSRAWDMATRLKYANFRLSKDNVHEQIESSIKAAFSTMNKNNTLFILPTYTALLSLEQVLKKETGHIKWQNQ